MLDCAINQGVVTAIQLLQQAIRIQDDGLLGPKTLAAAEHAERISAPRLVRTTSGAAKKKALANVG